MTRTVSGMPISAILLSTRTLTATSAFWQVASQASPSQSRCQRGRAKAARWIAGS